MKAKTIVTQKHMRIGTDGNNYLINKPHCGECGRLIGGRSYKFCPFCGTAILWKPFIIK